MIYMIGQAYNAGEQVFDSFKERMSKDDEARELDLFDGIAAKRPLFDGLPCRRGH